ncbi:type IV pilus modification protein PilV [Marinospirillum sp.]|uniref:type IV pilus modification protein PilV n=1 Tax=Marinospirillum sp. TaxID=2183934 RepID=UPI003A8BFCCE
MKHAQQAIQQGFSLIEVLVALLVVTLGLMGLILTQGHLQQQAFSAHQRSLAGFAAQDLQERLRVQVCFLPQLTTDTAWQQFIERQTREWRAAHPQLADWPATWAPEPLTGGFPQTDQVLEKAQEQGFWSFELSLHPPRTAAPVMQRLLVEYREVCHAS